MGFDFKPFVQPIYNAIMSRLTNQDQDQVCGMDPIFFSKSNFVANRSDNNNFLFELFQFVIMISYRMGKCKQIAVCFFTI